MNITKVNSVNFSKPVLPAFKSRTPENEENANQIRHSNIANKMVTVPVSLLMALTSMAVNPANPYDKTQETESPEMIAQAPQQQRAVDNPYLPYRLKGKHYYDKSFTDNHGDSYTVLLGNFPSSRDNYVREVLLIPHKTTAKDAAMQSYAIKELIIHEPPNKESWGGIWVSNYGPQYKTMIYQEIKLPDEIAQDLIDFLAGEKPYKNLDVEAGQAGLKWSRTQSNNIRPKEVVPTQKEEDVW